MSVTQGGRSPAYVRPMPRTWWLRTRPYRRFAARELTSVAVAAFSVILLSFLFALSRGRDAYEGFLGWLDSPERSFSARSSSQASSTTRSPGCASPRTFRWCGWGGR